MRVLNIDATEVATTSGEPFKSFICQTYLSNIFLWITINICHKGSSILCAIILNFFVKYVKFLIKFVRTCCNTYTR